MQNVVLNLVLASFHKRSKTEAVGEREDGAFSWESKCDLETHIKRN